MPLHVSSTRAHRQEAKIVLYNFWYHHTYRWPSRVSRTRAHHQEAKTVLCNLWYHHTYRCDDTRGCMVQFWPPGDEHVCSKHVEA